MYQSPTTNDFQRNLTDILTRTREAAALDDQRIRAEHASRGHGLSGTVIIAVAQHFDELHAAAIDKAMRLINGFAIRGLKPIELGNSARPILETFSEELVARMVFPGNAALNSVEQVRNGYRGKFKTRLDGALRDIEIGFIGGQSMAVPIKDADRRAVILQRLYDERHVHPWIAFPLPEISSQEEQIIAGNICAQLQQAGLIEWKTPAPGQPMGMAHITGRGIDVIEGNAKSPIAITIDRRVTITGSRGHIQVGDSNVQDIRMNADKIVAAINSSTTTEAEKEEAKSLLQRVLENPLLSTLIGLFGGGGS
jgi:hypothetical protein